MADFSFKLPEWNKPGAEPPKSKKDAGWQVDERPPAEYMNWLYNVIYIALKELQEKAVSLEKYTPEMLLARTEKIVRDRLIENDIPASKLRITENANRIKLANLADEVLQAMAGNTPINVTPGPSSVTTEKIAPDAVTPDKASFLKKSTNLFNKNAVTMGKYIANTGQILDNPQYFLTDYIPVKAGVVYTFKYDAFGGVFFTADKTYISGNVGKQFTAPANAAWFRMGTDKAYLNTQQMNEGTTVLPFEDYYLTMADNVKVKMISLADEIVKSFNNITTEKIALDAITPEKTTFLKRSTNLFDKTKVTVGKFLNNSGVVLDDANYVLSDYIQIKPGATYTFKTNPWGGCFYTADKVYITGNTPTTQTAPTNAAFFRMSIEKKYLDTQQMNEGNVLLAYEPFYVELGTSIKVKKDSIGEKSLPITKMDFYEIAPGVNMFNKNDPETLIGKFLSVDRNTTPFTAAIGVNPDYVLSHYIPVEENAKYINTSASPFKTNGFFDANKVCIESTSSNNFTTPPGTKFVRINLLLTELDTTMLYKNTGAVVSYEPYKENYELNEKIVLNKKYMPQSGADKLENYKRIYSISDAIYHWKKGDKFPVAFMGDSTTDGATVTDNVIWNTSTLTQDQIDVNAYSYILEQKLKAYTGNANMRIYNAGFSGWNTQTAIGYFSQIFAPGAAYADVKMIGFVYGINDRILTVEQIQANLEALCLACYQRGIQPFIVTPQIIIQGNADFKNVQTATELATVIVRTIKDFAAKYNLEVIDMNKATTNFISNAEIPIDSILPDTLHFGDAGHKFEAGFLFSKFIGDTIEVTNDTNILVTNPYTHYAISRGGFYTEADTFRRYASFNSISADTLYIRAEVLNSADCKLILTLDASANSNFYFMVDGVKKLPSELIELEIGHHTIEVWAGAGTTGKYYGFKLKKKR